MSQTTQKPKPDREDPRATGKGPDPKGRDDGKSAEDRRETDERLDEALEETFPSSDPVSVKITK